MLRLVQTRKQSLFDLVSKDVSRQLSVAQIQNLINKLQGVTLVDETTDFIQIENKDSNLEDLKYYTTKFIDYNQANGVILSPPSCYSSIQTQEDKRTRVFGETFHKLIVEETQDKLTLNIPETDSIKDKTIKVLSYVYSTIQEFKENLWGICYIDDKTKEIVNITHPYRIALLTLGLLDVNNIKELIIFYTPQYVLNKYSKYCLKEGYDYYYKILSDLYVRYEKLSYIKSVEEKNKSTTKPLDFTLVKLINKFNLKNYGFYSINTEHTSRLEQRQKDIIVGYSDLLTNRHFIPFYGYFCLVTNKDGAATTARIDPTLPMHSANTSESSFNVCTGDLPKDSVRGVNSLKHSNLASPYVRDNMQAIGLLDFKQANLDVSAYFIKEYLDENDKNKDKNKFDESFDS